MNNGNDAIIYSNLFNPIQHRQDQVHEHTAIWASDDSNNADLRNDISRREGIFRLLNQRHSNVSQPLFVRHRYLESIHQRNKLPDKTKLDGRLIHSVQAIQKWNLGGYAGNGRNMLNTRHDHYRSVGNAVRPTNPISPKDGRDGLPMCRIWETFPGAKMWDSYCIPFSGCCIDSHDNSTIFSFYTVTVDNRKYKLTMQREMRRF